MLKGILFLFMIFPNNYRSTAGAA